MFKAGLDEPVWFKALWDTGAMHSAITQRVVDECGLVQDGWVMAGQAYSGPVQAETYVIDLGLPNRVRLNGIVTTRGGFGGADVLIGMDVIGTGDFMVTNFEGQTKFAFRQPSQGAIDFGKPASGQTRKPKRKSNPGRRRSGL